MDSFLFNDFFNFLFIYDITFLLILFLTGNITKGIKRFDCLDYEMKINSVSSKIEKIVKEKKIPFNILYFTKFSKYHNLGNDYIDNTLYSKNICHWETNESIFNRLGM